MSDMAERLRAYVSGPHERGQKYTVVCGMDGQILLDAAAENARLRQNAAKWDRTGQATAQLENEAADRIAALQAEVAGLKHDIARHIEIASTECIARVEADDALTAANERIAVLENALSDARLVVEKWCWDQNNTQELIGPYLDPIDAALSTPLEDKP